MNELERLRADIKALADKWDNEAHRAMSMYGRGKRPHGTRIKREHAVALMRALASSRACNNGHVDLDQCDVGDCDVATPRSTA